MIVSGAETASAAAAAASPSVADKRVTILGATGSVGRNTLDLIDDLRRREGAEACPIEALTAHENVEGLAELAHAFRPKLAVIANPAKLEALRGALAGSGVEAAAGPSGLVEAADRPAQWVMAAIVGAAGLEPTLAAARRGASVALANKEALVCAGALLTDIVVEAGGVLLPVDSEHNAIFQVLAEHHRDRVDRLILTASGGPFRTWSPEAMAKAGPEEAVAHPVWSMGAKISVDSATLMNKGLELIEAHYLFGMEPARLDVVVHPQSIVHSLVEYVDGSVLAQLGAPDMRVPIASALAWPDRIPTRADRLDLPSVGQLTFEAPDEERFPALRLAREAMLAGPAAPVALNAANEIAVARFLDHAIGFLDISRIVERVIDQVARGAGSRRPESLEELLAIDRTARAAAEREIETIRG